MLTCQYGFEDVSSLSAGKQPAAAPPEMEEARTAYNYSVLKKHDPALDKIIFTSSICDVYAYDSDKEDWVQTLVKGTVFLYSRVAADDSPYSILVLNRNGPADFKLGITPMLRSVQKGLPILEADLQDSTLMIQVNEQEVFGLWLFQDTDRQRFLELVRWCITHGTA